MKLEVSCVPGHRIARLDELTLAIPIEGDAVDGRSKTDRVAQLMMLSPALGIVRSLDRGVVDEAEVIAHYLMPPVGLQDMSEVKKELAVRAIGISGAKEADTIGAGEFGLDPEVL